MYFTAIGGSGTNVVMRYRDLNVQDAAGNALPAAMEQGGADGFSIVVNDSAAQYPILIDPSLTSDSILSNAAGAFGTSVAYVTNWQVDSTPAIVGLLVGAPGF